MEIWHYWTDLGFVGYDSKDDSINIAVFVCSLSLYIDFWSGLRNFSLLNLDGL